MLHQNGVQFDSNGVGVEGRDLIRDVYKNGLSLSENMGMLLLILIILRGIAFIALKRAHLMKSETSFEDDDERRLKSLIQNSRLQPVNELPQAPRFSLIPQLDIPDEEPAEE